MSREDNKLKQKIGLHKSFCYRLEDQINSWRYYKELHLNNEKHKDAIKIAEENIRSIKKELSKQNTYLIEAEYQFLLNYGDTKPNEACVYVYPNEFKHIAKMLTDRFGFLYSEAIQNITMEDWIYKDLSNFMKNLRKSHMHLTPPTCIENKFTPFLLGYKALEGCKISTCIYCNKKITKEQVDLKMVAVVHEACHLNLIITARHFAHAECQCVYNYLVQGFKPTRHCVLSFFNKCTFGDLYRELKKFKEEDKCAIESEDDDSVVEYDLYNEHGDNNSLVEYMNNPLVDFSTPFEANNPSFNGEEGEEEEDILMDPLNQEELAYVDASMLDSNTTWYCSCGKGKGETSPIECQECKTKWHVECAQLKECTIHHNHGRCFILENGSHTLNFSDWTFICENCTGLGKAYFCHSEIHQQRSEVHIHTHRKRSHSILTENNENSKLKKRPCC